MAPKELQKLRPPKYLSTFGREAFAQLVVEWRLERGLSTAELADDAGVSVEVIKQVEKGTGLPPTNHLMTLSELLELSFEKVLRLLGVVETEGEELQEAALRYLATTANSATGSTESVLETLRFRRRLTDDRS